MRQLISCIMHYLHQNNISVKERLLFVDFLFRKTKIFIFGLRLFCMRGQKEMHLSNMAICLMDSDKANGGLYLDADDFLSMVASSVTVTGAHQGEEKEAPSCFYRRQLITAAACSYMRLTDYTTSCGSPDFQLIWCKVSINATKREQSRSQSDWTVHSNEPRSP